jgi:hypothetical protein
MELAESQISERGNERSTAISKEPSRTRMRLNRGSGSVLSGRHPVRFDYPGRELLAARGSSGRSADAVGPYRFCYPSSAATSISTSILRYAVTGISYHDRGPDKPPCIAGCSQWENVTSRFPLLANSGIKTDWNRTWSARTVSPVNSLRTAHCTGGGGRGRAGFRASAQPVVPPT